MITEKTLLIVALLKAFIFLLFYHSFIIFSSFQLYFHFVPCIFMKFNQNYTSLLLMKLLYVKFSVTNLSNYCISPIFKIVDLFFLFNFFQWFFSIWCLSFIYKITFKCKYRLFSFCNQWFWFHFNRSWT